VKAGIHPESGEHRYLISNRINLPASAGICNTLLSRLLAHASLHFYAESLCIADFQLPIADLDIRQLQILKSAIGNRQSAIKTVVAHI
jgi:hypothetical protein